MFIYHKSGSYSGCFYNFFFKQRILFFIFCETVIEKIDVDGFSGECQKGKLEKL